MGSENNNGTGNQPHSASVHKVISPTVGSITPNPDEEALEDVRVRCDNRAVQQFLALALVVFYLVVKLSGVHSHLVADDVPIIFAQPSKDDCRCGGQRT